MKRTTFLLVAAATLSGFVVFRAPASGQTDAEAAMVGNLRAAGLTGPAYSRSLVIADQDVRLLTPEYVHRMLPAAHDMKPGVFCFNPPYGVHMSAGDEKRLLALDKAA